MRIHAGGCLCGAMRYETTGEPLRVTICHCRFCQRATGGPYMVEPIFAADALRVTKGEPTVYSLRSTGSGKMVHVHFCPACGTKLYLSFERFPSLGVYAGTFDDPDWFDVGPDNARHIFVDVARPDSILPAELSIYPGHALANDGTPLVSHRFDTPQPAGRRGA